MVLVSYPGCWPGYCDCLAGNLWNGIPGQFDMIFLHYWLYKDYTPSKSGEYFVWFEDGHCEVVSWDFDKFVTDEDKIVYWANIPSLHGLDINYGKSI